MRKKLSLLTFLMMFCSLVFGQNHWTPIASGTDGGTMTITSMIYLDEVAMADDNIEIAAFNGEIVRGTAKTQFVFPVNAYIAFFTIRGNSGDQLTFKIYDHNTQTEYTLCDQTETYEMNKTLGDIDNPYGFYFTSPVAKIGETYYATLQAAAAAAQAGETITVLVDVETANVELPSNVTLDLNGNAVKADIIGKISINNGLWITSQGYKMIGKNADYYQTTDATIVMGENYSLEMVSGTVTLVPTVWYTLDGQDITIDEGAVFNIQNGQTFVVNGSEVVNNGIVNNAGTVQIMGGATVKGNLIGNIAFAGGSLITADIDPTTGDNFKMVGKLGDSNYYYNTDNSTINIAANGSVTVISGYMTLGKSWRTLPGQTVTIASEATFNVPAGKEFQIRGAVVVDGAIEIEGEVKLADLNATAKAVAGLNITSAIEGYYVIYKDGTYRLGNAVARIGETYYSTIESAVAAAKAGDEIDLLANVTIANPINVTFDLTIDGNGKTLTYTGSSRAITVEAEANGADLTVKNLTVDCTSSYCQRGINYNTNGALTLEGVTVKGTNVIYALNLPGSSDEATVTINNSSLTANIALNIWGEGAEIAATDSHFISVDNSTAEGYAAIKFNNDGTTSAENTSLNVVGGSIIAYEEDGTTPSIALEILTETDNYSISATTTVVGDIVKSVAIVKYTGATDFYSCSSLQEAIGIAENDANATVVIIRDITTSEIVTVNGTVVIDLNGKSVTSTAKKAIEVYANATIKNGTINGINRCVDTREAVELTLSDVTLNANEYTSAYGNPQPLTIGGSENGTKVNMTNVNISAEDGYGIISFVETELTATNANISGYSALYVKAGSNGSSFTFNNSTLSGSNADNDVEDNRFATIAIQENGVTVMVNGGKVIAEGNHYTALSIDWASNETETTYNNNVVTIDAELAGNIYNTNSAELNTVKVREAYASKLQAEGFITSEAENGLVTVIGTAAAKIGETYYATLKAAVEAAQAEDIVYLVRNSKGAGIVINKSITINFGGFTYSFTEPAVGSTGTQSNGFQILEGNNVTLTNGTLNVDSEHSSKYYILVQNYADLNVVDMKLDGTNLDKWSTIDGDSYVLSNNSGTINISGATSIIANDEGDLAFAFDACDKTIWGYELPTVTVNTTGTIDGGIEVSANLYITAADLEERSYILMQENGQFFHNGITATVKKPIKATSGVYGATDNWNTISTPVEGGSEIEEVEDGRHDLYWYDEANQYWRYQETGKLNAGQGYLYTNHVDGSFSFTGKLNTKAVEYPLSYTEGITLAGFNLIGNPFTHEISVENMVSEAVLADGFYTITKEGAWQVRQGEEMIAPLQSVLVKAGKAATLTINPKANNARKASNASLEIAVSNGEYKDYAYVSFGEGLGLDKIEHRNSDIPMVFVPVNGKEYAIATMNSEVKEIPVAFKAMTMGQYTIEVNAKGCEYSEMYLVDRLTGEVTDLINNDYTFIATSNDNANRFVITFAAETTTSTTDNFAFISNDEIIIESIEGKGVVRIYDMLGRPISEYGVTESARIPTSAFANGLYIIQMSDDNGVKVQKVVID